MDQEIGFRESWFSTPLSDSGDVLQMPVPSSYNDITVEAGVRDYIGWAWYDRNFYVSKGWEGSRVMLRFGSVHYTAMVYVNGKPVTSHSGGHLPFEVDVSSSVSYWDSNRVTVAVNNTLTRHTVPQGEYVWEKESDMYPAGYSTLEIAFDFFNYAGIHRPVVLYATPQQMYVKDITVVTAVSQDTKEASVQFAVDYHTEDGDNGNIQCVVELIDKKSEAVETLNLSGTCSGILTVKQPELWWPYLMSETPGYMYQLKVALMHIKHGEDIYRLPVGIREVTWGPKQFLINHKPFYFRGFGRHEDSDIRGKGLDLPLMTRDYNLIKWMGANSYRTSHYPYAEEMMDFADQNGIVIIDECPGVALDHFDAPLLEHHLSVMSELVTRDKNHPSVVMWSVGNEPRSYRNASGEYFSAVYNHTKALDATRPVTLVVNVQYSQDHASQHFDIICFNKYFGWYQDPGHAELIHHQMLEYIRAWHKARNKPIIVTEYGADTVAGIHMLPAMVFTEEYQVQLMEGNFKAFDDARKEGILIGEHIWNFADFMTKQEPRRVAGNKKGIFTRNRQPKLSAHVLRHRYWKLAESVDGAANSKTSSFMDIFK